jgi:peptidoglycan/xylan/chitin deacetylase (PgdA/CDA1 family)
MRFFMKKYIWVTLVILMVACAKETPETIFFSALEAFPVIEDAEIITMDMPDDIPLGEPIHNKIAETMQRHEDDPIHIMETDYTRPIIALTFDDGPGRLTARILDIVEKYNVRVTFCVVGRNIKGREALLKRAVENDNEIIGHSWNHQNMNGITAAEIKKQITDTHEAIEAAVGEMPAIFRPPYGRANGKVRNAAKELGFSLITWSVDTRDWERITADEIVQNILKTVKDGSLILCHELHESTVEAIDLVIPILIEQGYQFVTVSELLAHQEGVWEPGIIYSGKR